MFLEKEEVSLYYEVRGAGEPLLLIHGVIVDSWLYENTAAILQNFYQVITYDRRGSSRSRCRDGAEFGMDAQAGDIVDLLDELQIEEVNVIGVSAGAVLGQYFMQCYPQRVKKLIMYEPPLLSLLKDREDVAGWITKVENLVLDRKVNTAFIDFIKSLGNLDERAEPKPAEVSLREMGNVRHVMEDEYSVFIHYCPDLERCRELASRIVVGTGDKSGDSLYVQAAEKFADLIGCRLLHFPGCHNLPSDLPVEFAAGMLGTLQII